MALTESEKQLIKTLLDRGGPLPAELRPLLFPLGPLDKAGYDRATEFNRQFQQLHGTEWTTTHFFPRSPSGVPPIQYQAAWPWRREIWTLYFICRRSLGRAYCRYTTGEWAGWSTAQRDLERLGFLSNALAFHNGFEDRIAQLANCFAVNPKAEMDIHFCRFFDQPAPPTLPKTRAEADALRKDPDWATTHKRANDVKHRWTGEFFSQLPLPANVLKQVAVPTSTYVCFGLIPINPANIDNICETTQRSLNRLVGLAKILDGEIGWDQHFEIPTADFTP